MVHAYLVLIAAAGGVVVYERVSTSPFILLLTVCVGVALFSVRKLSWITCIALAVFSIVFLRTQYLQTHLDRSLDRFVGSQHAITATVVREPDRRSGVIHYVMLIDGSDARVRVTLRHFPRLAYGDCVTLSGVLAFPENFTSEHGITFNYIGFLAKDGIRYTMFGPQVSIRERGRGNQFVAIVYRVKGWFVGSLDRALKQPNGALAAGILLGTKQSRGAKRL